MIKSAVVQGKRRTKLRETSRSWERQFRTTAVNRGESYHKLRRAISHANFGKLRFKTEYEQEIWNECARLISNCVIFYNTTILSRLWEDWNSIGDLAGAAEILNVSPVSWNNINFRGRYKFKSQEKPIDIDEIVRKLAQIKVPHNFSQSA
ncbi:MAG: Tn3 family transposase [Gammaproteobacteria bacterium]